MLQFAKYHTYTVFIDLIYSPYERETPIWAIFERNISLNFKFRQQTDQLSNYSKKDSIIWIFLWPVKLLIITGERRDDEGVLMNN